MKKYNLKQYQRVLESLLETELVEGVFPSETYIGLCMLCQKLYKEGAICNEKSE